MTIKELALLCARLTNEGKGEYPVIWQSLTHSWDIDMKEQTRRGVPVFVVNP